MRRIFTYGTLAAPEVMEALLGRRLPARGAVLADHARYGMRDRAYPGLVVEAGARTEGLLYQGLAGPDVELLDHFEGSFYERRRVHVATSGAPRVEAEVYLIPEAHRHLLAPEPWDLGRFRRLHLDAWVRHCAGLRRPAAEDIALPEAGR